ncbi:MAG TPA: gamma-glutamyl-gamma-aminobutyrate hydrolase family protein [Vicinamibacteria bacterium]|nr:gamma-glutamyl-gamma-aminobutyrate hydrolase family protein [Vicinamibacteria bacterium]
MKRILVVLHSESEPLGALAEPIGAAGLRTDTRLAPDSLPGSLGGYGGLIVMGGSMGVYEADRFPFLSLEIALLREALNARLPTLAVCLGSQLLAAAGGARVYAGPAPEVGWWPVIRLAEDPWLADWPSRFAPLHWHRDTFDLPQGSVQLASSELYPHQAFRLGSALGLQFHVEATAAMAREWMREASAPADQQSLSEEAASRMAPLVAKLGQAFAREVVG